MQVFEWERTYIQFEFLWTSFVLFFCSWRFIVRNSTAKTKTREEPMLRLDNMTAFFPGPSAQSWRVAHRKHGRVSVFA